MTRSPAGHSGIWQADTNAEPTPGPDPGAAGPPSAAMASTRRVRPPPPGISRYAGGHRRGVQHRRHHQHRPQPRLVFSTDIAGPDFVGPAIKSGSQRFMARCSGLSKFYRVKLVPSINIDAIPGITAGEKWSAKTLQTHGAHRRRPERRALSIHLQERSGATASSNPARSTPKPDSWDYYDAIAASLDTTKGSSRHTRRIRHHLMREPSGHPSVCG